MNYFLIITIRENENTTRWSLPDTNNIASDFGSLSIYTTLNIFILVLRPLCKVLGVLVHFHHNRRWNCSSLYRNLARGRECFVITYWNESLRLQCWRKKLVSSKNRTSVLLFCMILWFLRWQKIIVKNKTKKLLQNMRGKTLFFIEFVHY